MIEKTKETTAILFAYKIHIYSAVLKYTHGDSQIQTNF